MVVFAVEGVQKFEGEFPATVFSAKAGVDGGGCGRIHGVVLNEGLRAEVTEAHATERSFGLADDHARRNHGRNGLGNTVRGSDVAKAGFGAEAITPMSGGLGMRRHWPRGRRRRG